MERVRDHIRRELQIEKKIELQERERKRRSKKERYVRNEYNSWHNSSLGNKVW